METTKTYENFPAWIVLSSNLLSIGIYALGFYILSGIGLLASFLFLIYVLALEIRIISKHCISCYYWGKTCGFGKGRLSALFFKKGDISRFCSKEMMWKDLIPDILTSLVPFVAGIVLLIIRFNFLLLVALVLLFVLTSVGNGFVRGSLTCKFCKQRNLGCPADKLFNK
jgi:hypothetical protein